MSATQELKNSIQTKLEQSGEYDRYARALASLAHAAPLLLDPTLWVYPPAVTELGAPRRAPCGLLPGSLEAPRLLLVHGPGQRDDRGPRVARPPTS